MEHDGCVGCRYEDFLETDEPCVSCKQNATDKYERMTNADRIRKMSVDELARLIEDGKTVFCCDNCEGGKERGSFCSKGRCYLYIKKWLESECDK